MFIEYPYSCVNYYLVSNKTIGRLQTEYMTCSGTPSASNHSSERGTEFYLTFCTVLEARFVLIL